MTFDFSIRAGDVLTVVSFIIMGIIAITTMRGTLQLFGYRLDVLDATVEDFRRDQSNNRLQDAEIARLKDDQVLLRKEIYDLQRGRGWVQPDVNGFYTRAGKVEDLK